MLPGTISSLSNSTSEWEVYERDHDTPLQRSSRGTHAWPAANRLNTLPDIRRGDSTVDLESRFDDNANEQTAPPTSPAGETLTNDDDIIVACVSLYG